MLKSSSSIGCKARVGPDVGAWVRAGVCAVSQVVVQWSLRSEAGRPAWLLAPLRGRAVWGLPVVQCLVVHRRRLVGVGSLSLSLFKSHGERNPVCTKHILVGILYFFTIIICTLEQLIIDSQSCNKGHWDSVHLFDIRKLTNSPCNMLLFI